MPAATVLRYPYEAITETTDYFQISIKAYDPKDISQSTNITTGTICDPENVSKRDYWNPVPEQLVENGIILLPMPSNIQDSNRVGYGPDSLDAVSALAASAVTGTINLGAGLAGGTKNLADIKPGFRQILAEVDDAVAQGVGDQVVNALAAQAASLIPGANVTARQLLTRGTGRILNPNMELLFSGVELRQFAFQFKMTPRDEKESSQVKSIIRSLKKNMAPKIDTGHDKATFLNTPNRFELAYRKGANNHPFLHKFKQCALTSMGVNYTGENVYATYTDGTPISTIMNLTFQELVPIYDKDYNDLNKDGKYTEDFDDWQLRYRPQAPTEGVGY